MKKDIQINSFGLIKIPKLLYQQRDDKIVSERLVTILK